MRCAIKSSPVEIYVNVLIFPIVGGYILYLLTPPYLRSSLGSNALHKENSTCYGTALDCPYNVTQLQGFGIELMTVFLLVLVVLAITDEKRESKVCG